MTTLRINVHASCVILADAARSLGAARDAGILILGDSGSGKSDLALRLITMGAVLVADDRCDLYVSSNRLYAAVPETLAGLIEVRGVGIISVSHESQARITLAARLTDRSAISRLPEPARYRPPPPLELPEENQPREILLAPLEASAPAKIIAATADHARH
jgi:hypothetical protein